jgi:hypothetical protein
MIIPRSVLLRMRNVSDKSCRENQHKFLCSRALFRNSCRLWDNVKKNIVQPDRPHMAVWRMCISCWVPKATNTHPEYVIFIAFPRQQLLHERNAPQCYAIRTLTVRPSRAEFTDHLVTAVSTNSLQAAALSTLWRPAVTSIIAHMKTVLTSQRTALA